MNKFAQWRHALSDHDAPRFNVQDAMAMMIDTKQVETMRDIARASGLTDLLVRIDRNLRDDPTHTPSKELVKQALVLLSVTEEPKAA